MAAEGAGVEADSEAGAGAEEAVAEDSVDLAAAPAAEAARPVVGNPVRNDFVEIVF